MYQASAGLPLFQKFRLVPALADHDISICSLKQSSNGGAGQFMDDACYQDCERAERPNTKKAAARSCSMSGCVTMINVWCSSDRGRAPSNHGALSSQIGQRLENTRRTLATKLACSVNNAMTFLIIADEGNVDVGLDSFSANHLGADPASRVRFRTFRRILRNAQWIGEEATTSPMCVPNAMPKVILDVHG